MTNAESPPLIRIFIGEPIQHRSELDCLDEICNVLSRTGGWAYIFANFSASGRQLDFAVFTERTTSVIEAKGYFHPVYGGTNGQWEQRGPYGLRKIGNAYNQASNARLALRDEIQLGHSVDGYPNGIVIVTPKIPHGSEISSDFKISIAGLDRVERELSRPSGALMAPELCERLAKQLRLEFVMSRAAAVDVEALEAERISKTYLEAWQKFYEPIARSLIADRYSCAGAQLGLKDATSLVLSSHNTVLIEGPPGCGKSLLATTCAMACLQSGDIPLFIAGRNFEGDFQKLLDKEAALLGISSSRILVSTAKLLNKRIALFLDGYNECRPDLQLSLTRSIRAFVVRHGASLVVSTQHQLVRQDLLAIQTIAVRHPSLELKATLAGVAVRSDGRADESGEMRCLLEVANSGLEATLIGHIGTTLKPGASRFTLFDTYARTKLGTSAREGVRILSVLAETLVMRACFSLSIREFDRLCDGQNLTHLGRQELLKSGLLDFRGGRVSYIHELFLSAYSAEAVIRTSGQEIQEIRAALASPRHHSSKKFIIGALENELILGQVIDEITDEDLLYACSTGECGLTARLITARRITAMLDSMVLEARNLEFGLVGEGWHAVEIIPASLHSSLKKFGCYLRAIGDELMSGRHVETVLSACRYVDETMTAFARTNATEAKLRKIPLKDNVFSEAYVMHRGAAISQLVNFIHGGGFTFRLQEGRGFATSIGDAWLKADTPGEYFVLLGLTKFTEQRSLAVPHVARLLQNIKTLPYHFQLALIDFSGYLREAEAPFRAQIIDSLHGALNMLGAMMNSVIFEALDGLGALDDEAEDHKPVIREEIQSVLSSDGEESDFLAWSIFSRQFDHPFDRAYWEEIQNLDDASMMRLLTKACRSTHATSVAFVGILIWQLAEFNDASVASAITRWTSLPNKTSCMPHDAVEAFFSAHEALGRLSAELPTSQVKATEPDEALLACGQLLYWANRADVKDVETSEHTLRARLTLVEHCRHSAASALQLTVSWRLSTDGTGALLVRRYPKLTAEICRSVLACRGEQVSYFGRGFNSDPDSIARFAIQVLGEVGTLSDATDLRELCDHKVLGVTSLAAIKSIEERDR